MLSLQLPIPRLENGFSTCKSKVASLVHHDRSRSGRSGSHALPSISLPKYRVSAIFEEEEVKGRLADAGVSVEKKKLPAGLQRELIPKHVAVIMDGNARWARQRGLPSAFGHEAGVRALKKLIELCCKWGIRVLTVFAFSTENWIRPRVEVDFLMSLIEKVIKKDLDNYMSEEVKISILGDRSKLSKPLQKLINEVEEITKNNSRLQLIIAVNYSGQYDIVQACTSIAHKVKDGLIQPNDITESVIEQELGTKCTNFPYPDLFIRTSGEQRISNFLLWQLAYTELVFVHSLWPDFGEAEFVDSLRLYQQRQRRYGGRES